MILAGSYEEDGEEQARGGRNRPGRGMITVQLATGNEGSVTGTGGAQSWLVNAHYRPGSVEFPI
jgi:hypothetical protein